MRHLIEPIPASEVEPGMYLYYGQGWYLAVGKTEQHPTMRDAEQIPCLSGNGSPYKVPLHGGRAHVAVPHHVPSTFKPAAMIRKARVLEQRAAEQIRLAELIKLFAEQLKTHPPAGR